MSFDPNPWGLHDMHGNVREWTEDCWNRNSGDAPGDGSAWTTGECSRRVLRGGSFLSDPGFLRAGIREKDSPDERNHSLGFRVARTLH